jgi:hypothetical protein
VSNATRFRASSELQIEEGMGCDFETNDDLGKQFIEVLVAIKVDSGTSGAMSKLFVMARAMSRGFSGMVLHRFTTSILQDSRISDNHLYTVG